VAVIGQELADRLKEAFASLTGEVPLEVFTAKGAEGEFAAFTRDFVAEISKLSPKLPARLFDLESPEAKAREVERSPTVLLAPDHFRLRYTGAPAGEEARSFLQALFMLSAKASRLSEPSRKRLAELKERRRIKVFVTPTCPYCPDQVLLAFAAAIERPELIEVEVIDIVENQDIAEKYNAFSVPQTVFDDKLTTLGLQPEETFVEELLSLTEAREVMAAAEPGETLECDLLILGGGPAGLTAAIYAARSGLNSVVVDRGNLGGQVAATPVVENYPGFTRVAGKALVDMMVSQALNYVKVHQNEPLQHIAPLDGGRFEVATSRRRYLARALLLATGASYRRLDVPGEQRFYGHGVSYCATCDGYLFRGKKVIMVGGGNSAVTEALYLDSLGAKVTLVHRRDQLRAEQRLQEGLEARKIPVLWNCELRSVQGETRVEAAEIENTKEGRKWREPVDGVFISIGYVPANEPAKMLGLALDEEGYVVVDEERRTSLPLVFAAGDLTGGIKQITTAVGQGAVAALTVFHDLERAGRPQPAKQSS
jgi:thioredoxin reductase (NADPH)